MRTPISLFFTALLIAVSGFLQACSGPSLRMRQVPANGYGQTLNYQFQAQVHSDSEGTCRRLVVRVRPLNKVYWKEPPPDRLQLFDDDCLSPLQFERVQYVTRTGEPVRLNGPELTPFWSNNFRLQNELTSWLWREGLI